MKETLERIQKDNAGAQRWMLLLTFIAAVGTVIAAVPAVQTWLTKIDQQNDVKDAEPVP